MCGVELNKDMLLVQIQKTVHMYVNGQTLIIIIIIIIIILRHNNYSTEHNKWPAITILRRLVKNHKVPQSTATKSCLSLVRLINSKMLV